MKIEMKHENTIIEVGDIVEYEGEVCIVGFIEDCVVTLDGESYKSRFPYVLLSLNTGLNVNAYLSLDVINSSTKCKLLSKSEHATLILK